MTEGLLKERKKMLGELVQDKNYTPMKLKELAMLLNIPRHQRDELKQVLDILVAEGKIGVSKKGKYGKMDAFAQTGIFCGHAKGFGFVKGFGITCGAMASTVAHDAHNLLVIGTNDEDMALAANTLIACGGGMTAVQNGKVLGTVPLPIAGLMNDKSAEEMSRLVEGLEESWKQIGCSMPSPFMTMALIPLACLPELRLTNRGLVDCTTFQFVPLEV